MDEWNLKTDLKPIICKIILIIIKFSILRHHKKTIQLLSFIKKHKLSKVKMLLKKYQIKLNNILISNFFTKFD
jgi:uncharacterized membrane protein YwzB